MSFFKRGRSHWGAAWWCLRRGLHPTRCPSTGWFDTAHHRSGEPGGDPFDEAHARLPAHPRCPYNLHPIKCHPFAIPPFPYSPGGTAPWTPKPRNPRNR